MTRKSWCAAIIVVLCWASGLRATTFTYQQGVNGYTGAVDTFLKESEPDTEQSNLEVVEWDGDDPSGTGQANYALIRFDGIFGAGVDQIPVGAQITSAAFTYTVNNGGDAGTVFDVVVDWNGLTTYNTFGSGPGVQPEDLGASTASATGAVSTHTIDVTASFAQWVGDPSANKGWIVLPVGGNGVEFRSSEYAADPTLRPKLTVTINEGEPTPILIRQPYLQQGTPTAMTIVWRTNVASTARVRYGLSPQDLSQEVIDSALATDHSIQVSGLSPGLRYYYDVGTENTPLAGGDADHYWVTPPPHGTPSSFSAWVVGDSGTGGSAQADVRDAMLAETGTTPPDIFIHVGDMAYGSGTDNQFTDNFFGPYANILDHTVVWPAIGNHEGASSSSGSQSGPYYESYVLPAAGQAGGLPSGTEAYYAFDYAHAHFVCLDSHDTDRSPGSAMLTWLAEDLAATDQTWLIAFWHHPPYTKGTHDSDNVGDSGGRMRDMRENILPVLEAGGVDVVLAGHSHIYERSFLVDGAYDTPTTAPGHILDGGNGIPGIGGAYTKPAGLDANQGAVYVTAGHGGASVGGVGDHPLMYFSEVANGSCLLTIDGNTLTLANIRSDGALTDTVQIVKEGEPDCNGNGMDDALDIANLISLDCNFNGTPDECEIDETSTAPGGPFYCTAQCDPDCNQTGVPDICELGGNDCNLNDIPDECEGLPDGDGDGIPDACDVCHGGDDSIDTDGDGVPNDCDNCDNNNPEVCSAVSPISAGPPHDILKNRYISIDPRGVGGLNRGVPFDIRVTLSDTLVEGVTSVGMPWWVGAPNSDCIAGVKSNPPSAPRNWDVCPALHLTGCPIIPTSTYEIVAVLGGLVSDPPYIAATQAKPGVKWWGDCVGFFNGTDWTPPQGIVNIDDAVAAIRTFQDPGGVNATHVSVTDVHPNNPALGPLFGVPNQLVNIDDVFAIILGFQGNPYPGPDIDLCR